MRLVIPLAAASFVSAVAVIACSVAKKEEPSGQTTQRSSANGVDCDVRYDQLVTDRLAGLTITEPTQVPIPAREKIRHLNELDIAPSAYIQVLLAHGIPIKLTGGGVTNFAEFALFHGVQPPGWEGTPYTWDDIPGTGTYYGIFLGDSANPNNAWSLALHEGTHAVDEAVSLTATSRTLQGLYAAELARAPAPDDQNASYRRSNIREFIAVGVDEYNCSWSTRASLESRYPDLFAYLRDSFESELQARL